MASPLRQHDQHSFLVLPENRLAVAAVQRLGPLTRRRTVQVVSLFGPPGCGKSRLARELIRSWEAKRSDGKIIYVTASEFAAELAQASTEDAIRQFQDRYRKDVNLFICEDIQALSGRKKTQQQLTAALDEIEQSGGCVLFTSTFMPSGIGRLSTRLVNRIRGGICVDIEPANERSRKRLIQHFLTTESIRLSDEQVAKIAKEYEVSPRELQGILNIIKISTAKTRAKAPVDLGAILADMSTSKRWTVREIAAATAKVMGIRLTDLKSERRSQSILVARQMAMFLARKLTDENLKTIGAYFGRGNHSTVIHACQKIEDHIQSDPLLAYNLELIEKRLRQSD